ncbi:hypothetical protein DYH09_21110 [bacterium CPR1]|nr:hypothetical protein [bacterium CPR1]
MRRALGTVALILGLTFPALGWGEQGHRVVGQIALDQLTPRARAQVRALLSVGLPTVRRSFNNLPIACTWPDTVRSGGPLQPYNHPIWHYSSIPFYDGMTARGARTQGELVQALSDNLTILADRNRPRKERARALAWVGHLVGDIHQPLHATTRYTPAQPRGDRGGNLFKIDGPAFVNWAGQQDRIDNLHSYWDQGCGLFLDELTPAQVEQIAREWQATNTRASYGRGLGDGSTLSWRQESYKLAVEVAYPGIRENQAPSEAYSRYTQNLCRRRIVSGGYRLAALLNEALR